MAYLKGVNFDDSPVRSFLIGFFKDNFNLLLGETPQEKKLIDLTGITETHIGVEGECGKWSGNFWENDSYSLISGLEFRTANIPIRKEKHWQEYPIRWKKVKHNPSFKHNIFARKYFYPIIPDLNCYNDQYADIQTPLAKRAAENVLSLPLYADLAINDVERICKIILE